MTRSQISEFARQNWMLISVLVISLAVALWFGIHFIMDFLYFNDPRHVDVDLKPWMTPRYIVLTYDVPRPFVFEVLGLDIEADKGIRLGRVAEASGLSMEELTEQVRAAIDTLRAGQQ
ncbi:hypothetical protein [Aliiroseovarius sp. 2305UL8-7]|uniref:hypothetical protein n=1 Tax=Aliiroseovarius conchicola TaxID=3121637 RepID=UPI0035279E6E